MRSFQIIWLVYRTARGHISRQWNSFFTGTVAGKSWSPAHYATELQDIYLWE